MCASWLRYSVHHQLPNFLRFLDLLKWTYSMKFKFAKGEDDFHLLIYFF